MTRPAVAVQQYREFLAASIEKALNAVPRAEELSTEYLTLPKDVQLETERRNRHIGVRAADLIVEKLRDAGHSADGKDVSEQVMEAILRRAIEQAQQELRRADDVEPEEGGSSG